MPWEVTGPVRERERFIETHLTELYTITELAERFGVSRQKLHKWLVRHNLDGMKALACSAAYPASANEQVLQTILDFGGDSRTWNCGRSWRDSLNYTRGSTGPPRAPSATFSAVRN